MSRNDKNKQYFLVFGRNIYIYVVYIQDIGNVYGTSYDKYFRGS